MQDLWFMSNHGGVPPMLLLGQDTVGKGSRMINFFECYAQRPLMRPPTQDIRHGLLKMQLGHRFLATNRVLIN